MLAISFDVCIMIVAKSTAIRICISYLYSTFACVVVITDFRYKVVLSCTQVTVKKATDFCIVLTVIRIVEPS